MNSNNPQFPAAVVAQMPPPVKPTKNDLGSVARRVVWGAIGFLGFLLSPLSWWNDAVVNVPIAIALARLVSAVFPGAFPVAFIGFYWLSSAIGLVIMHYSAGPLVRGAKAAPASRKSILNALGVSIAYTVAVVALVEFGVFEPIGVPAFGVMAR